MKMAVMFSVPFNYNFYENWQAVGMFGMGTNCDVNLYKEMYDGKQIGFVRGKASDSRLLFQQDDVLIEATMTDTCQPVLSLKVNMVKS